MFKKFRNLMFVLFVIAFATGCAKNPTHLELVIKTTEDLNKDVDGRSSPLMLTFYELESAEKFSKFDYWTLLEKSGDNLKDDLVSQSKHIILTEQKQNYKISFADKTKYLGIVANFRVIDNDYVWKDVVELKKGSYNYSEFEIRKFNIERVK